MKRYPPSKVYMERSAMTLNEQYTVCCNETSLSHRARKNHPVKRTSDWQPFCQMKAHL